MIDFIQIAQAAGEITQTEKSGGIIGTLGINWKLFIAQFVNFTIILAVLWKWVFVPVAKKLQERTDKIEKSLNDVDRIQKEKEKFTLWREEETGKARVESQAIISEAAINAEKVRNNILQKTKEEQSKLLELAKNQIASEKQQILKEAKTEIAEIITQATEKILRKKLDKEGDERLIKESIEQIK